MFPHLKWDKWVEMDYFLFHYYTTLRALSTFLMDGDTQEFVVPIHLLDLATGDDLFFRI
jgi:hypothetical protein